MSYFYKEKIETTGSIPELVYPRPKMSLSSTLNPMSLSYVFKWQLRPYLQ